MSHQPPAQLFDGSLREALASTPTPKTLVATVPDSPPQLDDPDFDLSQIDEFENFDWDAYNRDIARRLPPIEDEQQNKLRARLGTQRWISKRLPSPVVRWMFADLPPKIAWEALGQDELKPLKHAALRGFQQTPSSLKREPVLKRIASWFELHPEETHLLLLRWGTRTPMPAVFGSGREPARRRDFDGPIAFADPQFRGTSGRRGGRV